MNGWRIAAGVALMALALHVGANEWMIQAQPTPARVLGLSLDWSKLLFCAGCLLVIVAARIGARDWVHLVLGAAWFAATCGWQVTLVMTAIALAVYYLGGRLHPHLAMLATAVLLLLGARWLFGSVQPLRFAALAALRLLYYAFEWQAIPRRKRTLLGFLTYAPFSLLLWPGPTMLSYLTYTTSRPRSELDQLGSRQILRCGAKLLACALLLRLVHAQLAPIAGFATLPRLQQAAYVLLAYPLLFFSLSIRQDLAAALCNFSGHYAPDAFHRPFLAVTPFEAWRRWNLHQVDFLRLAFIYEAARRHRSLIVIAAAGMTGSALYHAFYGAFVTGPAMSWQAALATVANYFALGVPLLLLFIPIEQRRRQLGLAARVASTLATQLILAVISFLVVDMSGFLGGALPGPAADLLIGMVGF